MKKIKAPTTKFFFCLFSFFICLAFSKDKDRPYQFPVMQRFPAMPVNKTNPVTVNGVELGRRLFYDPIFSADSSISCSSCHVQKYAFSDSPNQLSKGIKGQLQQRNTLPLFNLAWNSALFWDGRAASIEDQVFHPLRTVTEMNSSWPEVIKKIKRSSTYRKLFYRAFGAVEIDSVLIAKAIAQFERTLISSNSKYDRVIRREDRFTMDELEGMELVNDMTKGNCVHCHTTDEDALGTTGLYSNNGLDNVDDISGFKDKGLGGYTNNAADYGKFKIPSLRNLLFTAPYMHDGRFNTLEEVLDFYSEHLKASPTIDAKLDFRPGQAARLNKYEKQKIIAFLKTLSDSTFIANPAHGNPFRER